MTAQEDHLDVAGRDEEANLQRLDAQKYAVEVRLSVTTRDEWWNEVRNKPEAVTEKYAQVRAWRDDSPTNAIHEDRLRGQGLNAEKIETIQRLDIHHARRPGMVLTNERARVFPNVGKI